MDAYNLVSKLKQEVALPVQLHCHYTSGMASMSYLKAIEAGVDVIDTATASLSLGGPASLLQTVWWLPCKEHPMIRV